MKNILRCLYILTFATLHGFNTDSFIHKLDIYAERGDCAGLHAAFCNALEEISYEADPEKVIASHEFIQEFMQTSYVPGTFYHPWTHLDSFVGYSWTVYAEFLKIYAQLTGYPFTRHQEFERNGFISGIISDKVNTDLRAHLESADIIPIRASMVRSDYNSHYNFEPLEEYYNSVHKFLKLEKPHLAVINAALEELKDTICQCMGSAFKVVNVRSWRTHPREIQYDQPSGWHSDGFPHAAKKIMIYVTGCSPTLGTTEFLSPSYFSEGPPGTWLFFENTKIHHRAIAPSLSEGAHDRILVEITVAPSFVLSTEPVCADLLAMWPIIPWR